MGLDDAQQDVQHGADRPRLALPLISTRPAQPFGHREDPLAHRQRRADVIDQVRRGLCHGYQVAADEFRPSEYGYTHDVISPTGRPSIVCRCTAVCAPP
jgi:hypothetical protein